MAADPLLGLASGTRAGRGGAEHGTLDLLGLDMAYDGTETSGRNDQLRPDYLCHIQTLQRAENPCQIISGAGLDATIGQPLLEALTPMALEVSLAVWQEIQERQQEADHLAVPVSRPR